jgi:hypothetical protein
MRRFTLFLSVITVLVGSLFFLFPSSGQVIRAPTCIPFSDQNGKQVVSICAPPAFLNRWVAMLPTSLGSNDGTQFFSISGGRLTLATPSIGGNAFFGSPTANGVVTDYDPTHIQTTPATIDGSGNFSTPGSSTTGAGCSGAGCISIIHTYDTGATHDTVQVSASTAYNGTNTWDGNAPVNGRVWGAYGVSGNNASVGWVVPQLRSLAFASLPTCTASTSDSTHVAVGTLMFCTDCNNFTDDTTGTYDAAAASGGNGNDVLCVGATPGWRNH